MEIAIPNLSLLTSIATYRIKQDIVNVIQSANPQGIQIVNTEPCSIDNKSTRLIDTDACCTMTWRTKDGSSADAAPTFLVCPDGTIFAVMYAYVDRKQRSTEDWDHEIVEYPPRIKQEIVELLKPASRTIVFVTNEATIRDRIGMLMCFEGELD